MHDAHEFLQTLTVVLCAAAVTTVLFQRLRQPVVLGYLLAGMIVGPHVPIPLQADTNVVADAGRAGRHSADVFARHRVQPAEAVARRADGRLRRRHAVQPDDLARLRGRPGLRLVPAAEPLRRGRDLDLQHDDHRQGVRGAADQRRLHAHRVRHSDRRRPDRHPADHDSDDALGRRASSARASWRSPPAGWPAFLAADDRGRPADRAAADAVGRQARPGRDDGRGQRRPRVRLRVSRGLRSATRSRSARSSPAASSPNRASRKRSSTWCSRSATCSPPSSSCRSAC